MKSIDDSTNFNFDANITANAGSVLVNLEQSFPFISNIVCPAGSPSAGTIAITFSTADAYNIAAAWPSFFQLFTSGSNYCGNDDGSRTFYNVTAVTTDATSNRISLAVDPITIQEATSRVQAKWGTVGTPAPNKAKRDESGSTSIPLDSDIFGLFADIGNVIVGGNSLLQVSCDRGFKRGGSAY